MMIDKQEIKLLPNMLSLSRILLLPVLYVFFFLRWYRIFLASYLILGVTDMLDGYLARKLRMVTKTGQFLDSIADICFNFSTAFFLFTRFPRISQEHMHLIIITFVIGIIYLVIAFVKFGKVRFIHTNLFRVTGVCIYACFVISFFIEPLYFSRIVLVLLKLSFIESILIYLLYGDVDPDVRHLIRAARGKRKNEAPR